MVYISGAIRSVFCLNGEDDTTLPLVKEQPISRSPDCPLAAAPETRLVKVIGMTEPVHFALIVPTQSTGATLSELADSFL